MDSFRNYILRTYPAFTHRDFVLQFVGQFVSNAGTQMQIVAINWQLYEMTHSPYVLALLGASRIIPIIVFSLISGTLVDAHNRKKILFVTQAAQTIFAFAQAILTFTGLANPANLIVLNAAIIAVYSLDSPARQALMPNLVKKEHFGNAVSLNVVGYTTSTIAGPALAGFAIAALGVGWVYALNAATFLILLACIAALRAHGRIEGARQPASLSAMMDGLRFVRSNTIIWSTMILDFFSTFFAEATILLPVFAKDVLHIGPELLGVLYAAPALGASAIGLATATIGKRMHTGSVLLVSVMLYAIATIVFGLSANYWLSLVALVVVGAGDGMSAIIRNIIRQLSTPDNIRGRMTAINQMFYTGGPRLGEVEAGVVAGLLGAPACVVIGGIGTILVVILMGTTIPALRTYRES